MGWRILEEGRDFPRGLDMDFRGDPDLEEAYRKGCECGYKKGYGDAMREVSGDMGFRGGQGYSRGSGMGERYPQYPVMRGMGFRDEEDSYSDMGERRRRDSRGRYM